MKTKKNKLFAAAALLLAAVVLTVYSCGDGPSKKPDVSGVSVTPSSLTLKAGESGTVNITTTQSWTATAPTGYTVTPKAGKGNATVTVKAGAGASGGSLTVTSAGKSASVNLQVAAAEITLSAESVNISYENGKSATFEITSNETWTITMPNPKPTWLVDVNPKQGKGSNVKVTVTTAANNERKSDVALLTIKCGNQMIGVNITKAAAPNKAPTKPVIIAPKGSAEYMPEISWNASTDGDGDEINYTVMLSKDKNTWTSLPKTTNKKAMFKEPLDKNTTYYLKVVADDGYDGGRVESDVVTFTTTSTKSYWADKEVQQFNIGTGGTINKVTLGSTPNPVKLIYMGDGYTQELYKYGGQFDQEIEKAIDALFAYEPYKAYANYFTVYVVAAYSNEAGMSVGSDWTTPTTVVDTKFKCTWEGGRSTGISCNTATVIDYAANAPGMRGASTWATGTNLTWSPISIIINTNQYAGTNIWSAGIYRDPANKIDFQYYEGYTVLSIAQTPARHPVGSGYGDSWNTLRHEFGGHGFGLLGDEYVYEQTTNYPYENEASFRAWQKRGTYTNIYLPEFNETTREWMAGDMEKTPLVNGANWKTFADRPDYAGANIGLFAGAHMYGLGIYRSENKSCMIDNRPHFNTFSRWKIYCRIMETAGKNPTVADFVSRDVDIVDTYGSAPTKSAYSRYHHKGPLLMDGTRKKPYRLR